MIKIIKRGSRTKITCENCGSLLMYESEDVKRDYQRQFEFIICPVCNEKIEIKAAREIKCAED